VAQEAAHLLADLGDPPLAPALAASAPVLVDHEAAAVALAAPPSELVDG